MGHFPAHVKIRHRFITAGLITFIALGSVPAAEDRASPDRESRDEAQAGEIDGLRQEIRELRSLILALQRQVEELKSKPAPASSAPAAVAPPDPPPSPPASSGAAPPPARRSLMNPAISAVFLGIGDTSIRHQRDDNGFDLSEAEIAFQSVVDPFAKVDLYLTFPAAESAEIEEGNVTTLALPGSLQLKGGRFKSAFGKWNTLHTHAFFTVDRPDALSMFLGDESFTNDGLSLSLLVPNPWDLYIEAVSEVGTAREGVAFNSASRALTYLQRLTFFFSLGHSSTLEAGASASWGHTGPAEPLLEALDDPNIPASLDPDGRLPSSVLGVDLTFKWKPPQRNLYRSFLWQTEVIRGRREVEELSSGTTLDSDTITSLGGYSYVEVQFAKRWRTGLRADVSGLPVDERARMWAASAVVRFQPSEFQELRFQVRRSRFDERAAFLMNEERGDTRVLFEWIPVIGAHGAHKY